MTDTVNVLREPTEAEVDAVIKAMQEPAPPIGAEPTNTLDRMRYLARVIAASVLAAAPKAEPVSDPYKLDVLPLGTPVEVDFKEAEVGHQTLHVAGVTADDPNNHHPSYWLSETWPVKCRGDISDGWDRSHFTVKAQPLSNPQQLPQAPKVEQEPCPERGMGVCDCSQCHPAPSSELLEVLQQESWDLRCFNIPTGGDDYDIGWRIIEHWDAEPKERIIAEVFKDDPAAAIRAALALTEDQPAKHKGPQS